MPNGTGLQGEVISAQSAVVAPLPQSNTQYYVFTVPDWQNNGPQAALRYSIVDMSLNGGMGDVTTQNVLINANVREQITAVQHCNRRDVWIITHEKGGNRYLAYLLTPAGLNMTPVISDIGLMPYTGNKRLGYPQILYGRYPPLLHLRRAKPATTSNSTSFDRSTGLRQQPHHIFHGQHHPILLGVFARQQQTLQRQSFQPATHTAIRHHRRYGGVH